MITHHDTFLYRIMSWSNPPQSSGLFSDFLKINKESHVQINKFSDSLFKSPKNSMVQLITLEALAKALVDAFANAPAACGAALQALSAAAPWAMVPWPENGSRYGR